MKRTISISVRTVPAHLRTVDNRGFCYAFGISAILISNIVYRTECNSNHSFLLARIKGGILLVSVLYYLDIWGLCINPIYSSITPVQLPILLGVGS